MAAVTVVVPTSGQRGGAAVAAGTGPRSFAPMLLFCAAEPL